MSPSKSKNENVRKNLEQASTSEDAPGSFEQNLAELEGVVERLESGELELATSLEQFKHGVELSKRCQTLLDEAQQVVDRFIDDEDPESQSGETSD